MLKTEIKLHTLLICSSILGKSVVGYNISLSNDGAHYSNEIQAFIIDSSCMSCVDNGGLCSIKVITINRATTDINQPFSKNDNMYSYMLMRDSRQFCQRGSTQLLITMLPI